MNFFFLLKWVKKKKIPTVKEYKSIAISVILWRHYKKKYEKIYESYSVPPLNISFRTSVWRCKIGEIWKDLKNNITAQMQKKQKEISKYILNMFEEFFAK